MSVDEHQEQEEYVIRWDVRRGTDVLGYLTEHVPDPPGTPVIYTAVCHAGPLGRLDRPGSPDLSCWETREVCETLPLVGIDSLRDQLVEHLYESHTPRSAKALGLDIRAVKRTPATVAMRRETRTRSEEPEILHRVLEIITPPDPESRAGSMELTLMALGMAYQQLRDARSAQEREQAREMLNEWAIEAGSMLEACEMRTRSMSVQDQL